MATYKMKRKNPPAFKRWTLILLAPVHPLTYPRAKQIVTRWGGTMKGNVATFKNADDKQKASAHLSQWEIPTEESHAAALAEGARQYAENEKIAAMRVGRKNPGTFRELEERVRRAENAYARARTAHSDSTTVARWNDLTAAVLALRDAKGRAASVKRNPVVRRHKTVAEMRAAGVPDYFEKIQKRGEAHRPSTMLYESGEQRPVAAHSGHFILAGADGAALVHRRLVGSDPNDTEITVRGLYDVWGRRKNPVPRASKAGPSGPRFGSGPERYYISDALAQSHARRLAPMTDENDHAGARLYLARTVLASPTFTEKVQDGNARMDRSHTSAYYNDNEAAWKANHALQKRMLAQIKRRTSPAGYAAINGAL